MWIETKKKNTFQIGGYDDDDDGDDDDEIRRRMPV